MALLGYQARYDYVTGDAFKKRVAIATKIVAHSQYQNNPPASDQDKINEFAKAVLKSNLTLTDPIVLAVCQTLVSRNTNSANDDASTDSDFFDDITNSLYYIMFTLGYTNTLPQ